MKDQGGGHRQRLWERYRLRGLRDGFFHDYEKLEFLLTFPIPRKDTKPLAKNLLQRFGSLNGIVNAPTRALLEVAGIGEKTAAFLKILGETALALDEERLPRGDFITQPEQVKQFLKRELGWEGAEYFVAMFLDRQNRLLKKQRLFRGTLDRATVYPREVIKEGLACNAAAVLVAHNHPSGHLSPSPEDLRLTNTLAFGLAMVDITLHDHFIVGREGVLSLRESGDYLPPRESAKTRGP